MGLLDKLWDDTVAGPRPDSGLGKLRKHNTFTFRSTSGKDSEGGNGRSYGTEETATMTDNPEGVRVTRSIMIVKPTVYDQGTGSAPASPAGSITPTSPFSGNRSGVFRFRRRSTSDAYEKGANQDGASTSPPPFQDV